jgi:predicted metalloprotease with PDZ domain
MKKIGLLVIGVTILASCGSSKVASNDLATSTPIKTEINISAVNDDKVPVTINPGRFNTDMVTYRLPKIVPGNYRISDFGNFAENFKAFDYDGNVIPSTKIDANTWTIKNAKNLDRITYDINDTYDIENGEVTTPFSPAGTNIEPENYVLNLHAFIGYFDSLKKNQYTLDVTAPSSFDRTSALQNVGEKLINDGKDIVTSYTATRYFDISDNPMMYGNLDIEEFQVGDIKIVLSVYSPNKVHTAASIKETVYKMMEAQKNYLGDINSTNRYDIYLYLSAGGENAPRGFGALEHHTSTVVVLPEQMGADRLAESMTDVVSHEFFHIVSPLSIHSEDVHYFDYNAPTFSKHLWMYEGVTEYFANLFQIDQKLIDEEEFFNKMILGKINSAKRYDDTMSFTKMSENILEKPYEDNYINVYSKGALIGMCIDLIMREESNGDRGILSLMKELSLKYGKNKPFEDDKLIDEIVAMTYPSIKTFFDNHVIGETPIDYTSFLEKVGLKITTKKIETNYIQSAGQLIFRADREKGLFYFNKNVENNSFWVENGVKAGDQIKKVGGQELTMINAQQVLGQMFAWVPGSEVEITIERDGKEIPIKTTLTQSYATGNGIEKMEDASEKQLDLRKSWY